MQHWRRAHTDFVLSQAKAKPPFNGAFVAIVLNGRLKYWSYWTAFATLPHRPQSGLKLDPDKYMFTGGWSPGSVNDPTWIEADLEKPHLLFSVSTRACAPQVSLNTHETQKWIKMI